jgi:hypothetical protein
VGPRAGLDGCGKPRPRRNSIPGPSGPWQVAIPTELSRPQHCKVEKKVKGDSFVLSSPRERQNVLLTCISVKKPTLALPIVTGLNQEQVTQSFQKSRFPVKFLGARRVTEQVPYHGPKNPGTPHYKIYAPGRPDAHGLCTPNPNVTEGCKKSETSVTVYQSTRCHIPTGQNQCVSGTLLINVGVNTRRF